MPALLTQRLFALATEFPWRQHKALAPRFSTPGTSGAHPQIHTVRARGQGRESAGRHLAEPTADSPPGRPTTHRGRRQGGRALQSPPNAVCGDLDPVLAQRAVGGRGQRCHVCSLALGVSNLCRLGVKCYFTEFICVAKFFIHPQKWREWYSERRYTHQPESTQLRLAPALGRRPGAEHGFDALQGAAVPGRQE